MLDLKRRSPSPLRISLNQAFHLLSLARLQAAQRRLAPHEQEDCTLEFVERLWLEHAQVLHQHYHGTHFETWLNTCARNHVTSYCRRLERIRQHEAPWPEPQDGEGKSETAFSPLLSQHPTHMPCKTTFAHE